MSFKKEWMMCKRIKNDKKRESCTFNVLHKITKLQDDVQLSLPKTTQEKALSQDLINDANAIILELSKNEGELGKVKKLGYYNEKIESLCRKANEY